MKLTNIDKAFDVWKEQGLLDDEQVDALRSSLDESQSSIRSGRAVVLFSTLGAVLVGLGVILFVASHWETMGPGARSLVLLLTYAATCGAAYATQMKDLPLLSESLWFLATLVLGADIFFIGQIFNFTLTFWQGPFLWAVGALAMGYARQKAAYGWLAVPLGLLALGWLGGGSGWFTDDQMEFLAGRRGLLPLLPVIGLGLICLGRLARVSAGFGFVRPAASLFGLVLIAAPLIVATADDAVVRDVFDSAFTLHQIAIMTVSGLAVAFFAALGKPSSLSVIVATVLLLVFVGLTVPGDGGSALGELIAGRSGVFVLFILLVFGLAIASIWIGLAERSTGLINAGLLSAALIIFIQYFSWSFELLD
ncbi:MAG: DUF2157 domain-containing protein, partial [Polyangiales bacterium]